LSPNILSVGTVAAQFQFSLFIQRLWLRVLSPRVVLQFKYQRFEGICCMFYPKDEDSRLF